MKQDPKIIGLPTVLSIDRLPRAMRRRFRATENRYMLASLGKPLTELPASRVAPIEKAWLDQVLR